MLQEIGKIQYRGFVITILQTPPTRFGILYECINDIGEPKLDSSAYNTKQKAIDAEKLIIDEYILDNGFETLLLTSDDYMIIDLLDKFICSLEDDRNFVQPEFKLLNGKMVKEYSMNQYCVYKDAGGTIWFDSGFDIQGMVEDLVDDMKFYS